ncbi:MAG: acylneuraminate cytidylyltransferase family protein [Anaerolineae bacterium]|jgi:CMP-N-acetylneuraminic acid synthetase|nr:acylneuraminate cytidylyltransferase family protein [Anaerolineae bacterium]MBT4458764.1 acylneuraminate cytidylyltransferase family protein [Anaerolineae bacterium]MBT4842226.1 acylneuraminate cytidylyltransferase family protein [Anaerolineae bacterium]MBT6062896.1 acylneuraminate cytidylyltransferase family protein [Anaerolineae bacterium]MBT6323211.1 acylneuraminate cytidylyltransferase family protein [Anaerolineae bacterium]
MTKIAALVPMRHHSQRVPGKNYRELAGKPLFHHIIETLESVPEIDIIVVDTDSQPIMDGLREHFPDVVIINRPEHLREDDRPMNDILLYDTEQVDADFYLQTHSTNPLLRAETVSAGIRAFLEGHPAHDSLFSVTRWQTRLYDRHGEAINHDPEELIQTQDLPPVYEENSCIYLFTRENLIQYNHRVGKNPLMFEIPAIEAVDIDEESDFEIADILKRKQK